MKVELVKTEKVIHGIKVVHIKTNNLMSYIAYHCLSGSYHENEKNQGVSHYLEHMFFKGTEKRGYAAISDDAALQGANQNAFTSELDTCYYLTVPSQNYDPCIELLTDMMFHSKFPTEEIDKERTVIQAERKSYEDSPSSYYWEVVEKKLLSFNLGHSVIGTEETIDNITQESLIDFKNKFYGKNNIILLIMSSVDAEEIFASCETHLIDNKLEEVEVTSLDKPIFIERNDISFTHPNIQQSFLTMCYSSEPMNSDNDTLQSCLKLYLGGGLYGVLGKVIREELGLCYNIGAYGIMKTLKEGISCIFTQLDTENVQLAKDNIIKTLEDISTNGVDEVIYNCAKAQILSKWCSAMDNPLKLSRSIAQSELFDYELDIEKSYKEVNDMTYDMFNDYAKKVLKDIIANHNWVEMSPEK